MALNNPLILVGHRKYTIKTTVMRGMVRRKHKRLLLLKSIVLYNKYISTNLFSPEASLRAMINRTKRIITDGYCYDIKILLKNIHRLLGNYYITEKGPDTVNIGKQIEHDSRDNIKDFLKLFIFFY